MALPSINGARAAVPPRCQHDDAMVWHSIQWFRTTAPSLRGVALLIHGLNQKPSAINPVAVELNNMGIDVLRLDLRGHGSNFRDRETDQSRLDALAQVTADTWLHEALCAYEKARAAADAQNAPVFLVAFSLGALVGVELLSSGPEQVRFDRMILLSPAIRTRWYLHVVRALAPWPTLAIPSAAPEQERANDATPIAAYEALFTLEERLHKPNARRLNIPTLVLMDEEDELVDADAIREMIVENGLHRWDGARIHKADEASESYHHAITDVAHVGRATWTRMMERIQRHLLGG